MIHIVVVFAFAFGTFLLTFGQPLRSRNGEDLLQFSKADSAKDILRALDDAALRETFFHDLEWNKDTDGSYDLSGIVKTTQSSEIIVSNFDEPDEDDFTENSEVFQPSFEKEKSKSEVEIVLGSSSPGNAADDEEDAVIKGTRAEDQDDPVFDASTMKTSSEAEEERDEDSEIISTPIPKTSPEASNADPVEEPTAISMSEMTRDVWEDAHQIKAEDGTVNVDAVDKHDSQSDLNDLHPEAAALTVGQSDDAHVEKVTVAVILSSLAGIALISLLVIIISRRINRLRRHSRNSSIGDYRYSGFKPPGIASDEELAKTAQMYHYYQQRRQMTLTSSSSSSNISPEDSLRGGRFIQTHRRSYFSDYSTGCEEELDADEYTVYECPGLAPAGEMEVRNPFFVDRKGSVIILAD